MAAVGVGDRRARRGALEHRAARGEEGADAVDPVLQPREHVRGDGGGAAAARARGERRAQRGLRAGARGEAARGGRGAAALPRAVLAFPAHVAREPHPRVQRLHERRAARRERVRGGRRRRRHLRVPLPARRPRAARAPARRALRPRAARRHLLLPLPRALAAPARRPRLCHQRHHRGAVAHGRRRAALHVPHALLGARTRYSLPFRSPHLSCFALSDT